MAGNAVDGAVQGLTDWDGIAKFVDAFGGGWEAVAAIGIITAGVVVIVLGVAVVTYLSYRSRNLTRIQLKRMEDSDSKDQKMGSVPEDQTKDADSKGVGR